MTALPPEPFAAQDDPIPAGETFYRVHSSVFAVDGFNPGIGAPSRFAFFGSPPVPILYAAASEEAAVAESLLHDVPKAGGVLVHSRYADQIMGRIIVTRSLRLAKLRGLGLRALGVEATDVTDTDSSEYARTATWAESAYDAGFDGVSWTSRKCNDAQAIVLFGDRCGDAIRQDTGYARIFRNPVDLDWLIGICEPLHVEVELARMP